MKFLIAQTVQLKGVGIPGVIFKVLPEFKTAAGIINEAYAVQWVDGLLTYVWVKSYLLLKG